MCGVPRRAVRLTSACHFHTGRAPYSSRVLLRSGRQVTNRSNVPGNERVDGRALVSLAADGLRRGRPRSSRLIAVTIVAAASGCAILAIIRLGGDGSRAPPDDVNEESADAISAISLPAFSSGATVADLKQASAQTADELTAAYPDAPDAWNVAAQLQFHLGSTPEAVRLWEKCLSRNPRSIDALYGLGYIAHLEGDNAKAVERFRAAWAAHPEDRRVPLLLAEGLARLGKPEEAATLLLEHLRTGHGTLGGLVLLGQIYLDLNEYDKARSAFQKAVEIDPQSREAQFGLAAAWARLGDAEKSRQAMTAFQGLAAGRRAESSQRVKDLNDPTKAREIATLVHGEAAKVYLAHGNLSKAEEAWRKTAALDPKNVACRMELVGLYERTNRNRAALRACEELRDLEPGRADHWLNIAVLSARLAQREAALAAIDRAIALEPNNPKYREARETIQTAP